jgi:hypothetical protein
MPPNPPDSPVSGTLICRQETEAEFRAVLAQLPELREFIAEAYRAGLMTGMRGAILRDIATANAPTPGAVRPVLPAAAETRLLNKQWAANPESKP